MNLRSLLPVILSLLPVVPAQAGTSAELASAARPSLTLLARRLTVQRWSGRVTELVATHPSAGAPGSKWQPGDPHFDAAKKSVLARIESWAGAAGDSAQAAGIVDERFRGQLPEEKATAIAASLATPAGRDLPALCDYTSVAVAFAMENPKLKIGTAEFQQQLAPFVAAAGFEKEPPQGPELMAIRSSPEGRAYSQARSFSLQALQTQMDGAINLALYDSMDSIGADIAAQAAKCAKARH